MMITKSVASDMPVTKPSSASSAHLPFIVFTGVQKTDPETRTLIRKHVMMGKNRGKSRSLNLVGPKASQDVINEPTQQKVASIQSHSTIPRKVGSDLAFIPFSETVEPAMIAQVLEFSSVAKKVVFSLESCVAFDRTSPFIFMQALTFDAAYLHAMIFATQAYSARIAGPVNSMASQSASLHYMKTVRLLQERLLLDDRTTKLSDSTLNVVLALAWYAHVTGDCESSRHHMAGLRTIIKIRGGFDTLRDTPKLLLEIIRFDIEMALDSGERPLFSFNDTSYEPFLPYLGHWRSCHNENVLENIDKRLARAWAIMEQFCSLINRSFEANYKIPQIILRDTMASVMYNLLDLRFGTGSVDEAIRLGLLAFSSRVFLQWQAAKQSYRHLAASYQSCLCGISSSKQVPNYLSLWLLIICGIFTFDAPNDNLRQLLRAKLDLCGVSSWGEMRDIMDSVLWIGLVLDNPGEKVFESVLSPEG